MKKNKTLSTKIDEILHKRISEHCEKNGIKINFLIRDAVEKYLNDKEKK